MPESGRQIRGRSWHVRVTFPSTVLYRQNFESNWRRTRRSTRFGSRRVGILASVMGARVSLTGKRSPPLPDVFVSARFGIYSSPYPAQRLPSGELRPRDQKRPVWLVTFYGAGIKVQARGSSHPPIIHVINALVDAASGEVLSVGNG